MCSDRTRSIMQRLPGSVLQEIQREGESKDEGRTGGAGAAAARGQRMGEKSPPKTSEASVTFTTPNFSPPTSPSPPFLGEIATKLPTRTHDQPSTKLPGTSTVGLRDWGSHEASQDPHDRPSLRSGEIRAPWWTSSSEEISPQFMGRGLGADALGSSKESSEEQSRRSSTPTQQDMGNTHHTFSDPFATKARATADVSTASDQAATIFNTKPFEHTSSNTSSSESSAPSSAASSFAYQLRRRVDMRLLRKRYRPSQHRKKHAIAKVKTSPPLRSPTYGIPKVVEDSRDSDCVDERQHNNYEALEAYLDKSAKAAVKSLKLPPPKQPRRSSNSSPGKRSRDCSPGHRSSSPASARSKPVKQKRPGILRSSASLDVTELPSLPPVRAKRPSLSLSKDSSQGSAETARAARSSSAGKYTSSSSRQTPISPLTRDPLPSTPKSADTGKSETNPFQTDDNYFSTLRTKITSRQAFTPTLSPMEPDQPSLDPRTTEQPGLQGSTEGSVEQWPGMSPDAMEKRQKRGSIFSIFGLPVPGKSSTPNSLEKSDRTPHDSPAGRAPDTANQASEESLKKFQRRLSNDHPLPPYFARPKRRQANSDVSPSPMLSPASTNTRESAFSKIPHSRDASDELGPISPFTPLPPLREDYDRNRRVSIEIPGTPGIHHRPSDTPAPSPVHDIVKLPPAPVQCTDKEDTTAVSIGRPELIRRLSFRSKAPSGQQIGPDPPSGRPGPARKRSSVYRNILPELNATASYRKASASSGERIARFARRRRSAITPITRQATFTSTTSKPVKRTFTLFKRTNTTSTSLALALDPRE